jgi:hypothetical protein
MSLARLTYESWHSWQALVDSYPSFAYGTTTTRTGFNLDGLNTVSWEDIPISGVLGQNQCAWSGSSRVDSDTKVDNQFSWDWDNSVSVSSYSLRAVMEHELGHGLSLGHTCDSDPNSSPPPCNPGQCDGTPATPLMCPAVANGQRKAITADDQAGAAALYAESGSTPGAPPAVQQSAGSGSYNVSWTASSGSPLAYEIERGNSACSGGWIMAGTVDGAVTSFVDDEFDTGLPAGTYCYSVKALGQGGDSNWTTGSQPTPTPSPTPSSTPSPTPSPRLRHTRPTPARPGPGR